MMKVIIDGRLLLPQMTGIGRYILGLTYGLSRLQGNDEYYLWLQTGLPPAHPIRNLPEDRFSLSYLPTGHMTLQQQWKIPFELKKMDCDLFHYPHFDLPFAAPGNIVTTIHDLKYIAHPEFFPNFGSGKRILMWVMMFTTVRRSQQIITVSENSKQDIIRYLRPNPRKLVVIPEGVDSRFKIRYPSNTVDLVLEKYNINSPFILSVGERRPHKNLGTLIRAFNSFLKNSKRKYHLIITGKPYKNYNDPERLVEELQLTDYVHFVFISDEDLPLIYQAADVYVNISLYEGFGLPVLEAMASATPVIASNLTSLPEVMGSAGILVDPYKIDKIASALTVLTHNRDVREDYIKKGIRQVERFSWENCAQATLEIYQKAITS